MTSPGRPRLGSGRFDDSFPQAYACSLGFRLGAPTGVSVVGGGTSVLFLRSKGPDDWSSCLFAYDPRDGRERLIADPGLLLGGSPEEIPEVELSRRERSRESRRGIVEYGTDQSGDLVAFALSGRLFCARIASAEVWEVPVTGPVIDPRPAPCGDFIAFTDGRSLRVVSESGEERWRIADPSPDVVWGLAEHLAAEEMGRQRGYWWSPDGSWLLATRVDLKAVPKIAIADPLHPTAAPAIRHYPFAGSPEARVGLYAVDAKGRRQELRLPRDQPYLVACSWPGGGPPLAVTQTRDQTRVTLHELDIRTGGAREVATYVDPAWCDVPPGVPSRLGDGRIVFVAQQAGWSRLLIEGMAVTPDKMEVREVAAVTTDSVYFTASVDPTEIQVWCWRGGDLEALTRQPGVHGVVAAGEVTAISTANMHGSQTTTSILVRGSASHVLSSLAEPFPAGPPVRLLTVGERGLRVGLVLPENHPPGQPLPVLLDPYGGPAQRVLAAASAWLVPRWFAQAGFAVVVADGRGSPGRGSDWERGFHNDVASVPLQDQVDALHAVAALVPELDLGRVAIRGWSFGGYLAAMAVFRRPDVFHAAIVGAPVSDWRLYDSYISERWLGDPRLKEANYVKTSLLAEAGALLRPMLLVHGLADDNVVVGHSLRLSDALFRAGQKHELLLLAGTTHMATGTEVAERLLLAQRDFLLRELGSPGS
jgi:dipeptidyl-peptidase-4